MHPQELAVEALGTVVVGASEALLLQALAPTVVGALAPWALEVDILQELPGMVAAGAWQL